MNPLSAIKAAARSFYRSGAWCTGEALPRVLKKIPLPGAAITGRGLGALAGIASVIVGVAFLYAIPLSLPMFAAAVAITQMKGALAAAAATVLLGGTGGVVLTTGLGLCTGAIAPKHSTVAAKTPKPRVPAADKPAETPAPTRFGNILKLSSVFHRGPVAAKPKPAKPAPKRDFPIPI
jgi:hypothetical protein